MSQRHSRLPTLGGLVGLAVLCRVAAAGAQAPPGALPPQAPPPAAPPPATAPPPGVQPAQPYGYPPPYTMPPAPAPPRDPKRSPAEIGTLYAVSVAYGVGIGVWLSNEIQIDDPGVFLIAPAVLGVAAPVGVYVLDQPSMDEGLPAATAAGMIIGAAEGIGIAGFQFVSADREDAWGFRGLSRATALGATLGAVGGYAVGYYQEPPPESSAMVTSAVAWGTLIGSAFGYGASSADDDYGEANDAAALGGLVGFNAGLVGGALLSAVFVPSWTQIGWMWAGLGVGAAVSLPVFLFYAADDAPPAKRGLLFSGTAMTLGLAAGALFSSGSGRRVGSAPGGGWEAAGFSLDAVTPVVSTREPGVPEIGIVVSGRLL